MTRFFQTDRSATLFFQRLVLALVILPHGAQKLLGWFGGYGFDGTMGFFTGTLGIPAALAVLVILGESLGALGLAFGAFTRLSAFGVAATMLGAVFMAHAPNGFFMNWTGQQAGEGFGTTCWHWRWPCRSSSAAAERSRSTAGSRSGSAAASRRLPAVWPCRTPASGVRSGPSGPMPGSALRWDDVGSAGRRGQRGRERGQIPADAGVR